MEDYAPAAHHRSPQLTRAAELQLTRSSELPPGMTSQSTAVGVIAPNNFVASSAGGAAATSTGTTHSLDLQVDFTRPDGNRTRPLLIDGKRLYVDEHYVSVWSPILRLVEGKFAVKLKKSNSHSIKFLKSSQISILRRAFVQPGR